MIKAERFEHLRTAALAGALGLFGASFLAGCGGGSESPPANTAGEKAAPGKETSTLPTASIGAPASASTQEATPPAGQTEEADKAGSANQAADAEPPLPKEGSPEWILGQMIVLRAQPLPAAKSLQESGAPFRERNQKLVEMAHEVITKTHKDKSKEQAFNAAVHFLSEARLNLATTGNQDDVAALYDDAKALYERDPNSIAAAEAAVVVVRLAHVKARKDPRMIQEFAVQARLFASRFPKSETWAVQFLSAAGQSCELRHLDAEAVNCYSMLQDKYPKCPQAEQAAAVLRRLELKGNELQLGGETANGGFVNIKQFRGKPVLVVYWASDSEKFQEILPKLKETLRPYEKTELTVIGVCLDENESAMDSFIEKNGLSWTEIFYAAPAKRHWDIPVVRFYGVHDIPSLWLVNAEGKVVDTHVSPDSLSSQLRVLVAASGPSARHQ